MVKDAITKNGNKYLFSIPYTPYDEFFNRKLLQPNKNIHKKKEMYIVLKN
jgi:hypothetical protein